METKWVHKILPYDFLMQRFCSRHKGIVKSEADSLTALPEYIRIAAQSIFYQVLKYFNECIKLDDSKRSSIVLGWVEGVGREGDVFRFVFFLRYIDIYSLEL